MQSAVAGGVDEFELGTIGLDVGMDHTLVVTGHNQNFVLEFLHGEDTNWHEYPGIAGAGGSPEVIPFRCISARMRVKFAANIGAGCVVSCPPVVRSTF